MFAVIATAIGSCNGHLGAVDLVGVARGRKLRDVSVDCSDSAHAQTILQAVRAIAGVRLIRWSDRVFMLHEGGKIEIANKFPLTTRDKLSMAYTPGVARICSAIAEDKRLVDRYTIRGNMVAIVSDGTAVLGLGDIGPEAAMPVMEGKAMLFKEFGGVNAFPICLATKVPDEIVRTVKLLAPTFGGINLEDISAPRCFEIEDRLKAELDIPVFHDDQHGTAVVAMAALDNALKLVNKHIGDIRVVVLGIGAAGVACTKIFMSAGVRHIIGVDRAGVIYRGRPDNMNPIKEWLAENTNPDNLTGGLEDALRGADVLLGVSGPGMVRPEHIRSMARDPIVFALANPMPEIMPEEAEPFARIIATGRSDYPNQINNVLCFPGIFRGAFDAGARTINEPMKLAAARALASIVAPDELSDDNIIPSVFDKRVAPAVAAAVAKAAIESGVGRPQIADGELAFPSHQPQNI